MWNQVRRRSTTVTLLLAMIAGQPGPVTTAHDLTQNNNNPGAFKFSDVSMTPEVFTVFSLDW